MKTLIARTSSPIHHRISTSMMTVNLMGMCMFNPAIVPRQLLPLIIIRISRYQVILGHPLLQ